jgi:hypothetical protein
VQRNNHHQQQQHGNRDSSHVQHNSQQQQDQQQQNSRGGDLSQLPKALQQELAAFNQKLQFAYAGPRTLPLSLAASFLSSRPAVIDAFGADVSQEDRVKKVIERGYSEGWKLSPTKDGSLYVERAAGKA